jgi:hypothetical protein
MAGFDDGSGAALYVTSGSRVAKWNGKSWSLLPGTFSFSTWSLAVYDDGTGPALYVAGGFNQVDGLPVNRIARWNGQSWSALGQGLDGFSYCMCVFDAGSGPALYVGGLASTAGGVSVSKVARWNGSEWSALGVNDFQLLSAVRAIAVYDLGGGVSLFAGGEFGYSPAGDSFLAKWGCVGR